MTRLRHAWVLRPRIYVWNTDNTDETRIFCLLRKLVYTGSQDPPKANKSVKIRVLSVPSVSPTYTRGRKTHTKRKNPCLIRVIRVPFPLKTRPLHLQF